MAKLCLLLADGFEEIEAITTLDVLRRADLDVAVLGVSGLDVRGAHGLRVQADALLRDGRDDPWQAVVLPGGPGAETLRDDLDVQTFLRHQGGLPQVLLAAICAAPMALAHAGLLHGIRATCYPGYEQHMGDAKLTEAPVVVDGRIVTSRGPATAMAFGLTLVEMLRDRRAADEVRRALLAHAQHDQPS